MNICWDTATQEFVAEFSSDFQGDLEAVKAAGFHTTGPPEWRWYAPSPGVKALNRLRANKPKSGLTITSEAREQYTPLAEIEAKNAETMTQLAKHTKVLKKTLKIEEQEGKAFVIPEKGYIDASDFPPLLPRTNAYIPPSPPDTKCCICGDSVYPYEKKDPLICLWCEKNVLDFFTEVC